MGARGCCPGMYSFAAELGETCSRALQMAPTSATTSSCCSGSRDVRRPHSGGAELDASLSHPCPTSHPRPTSHPPGLPPGLRNLLCCIVVQADHPRWAYLVGIQHPNLWAIDETTTQSHDMQGSSTAPWGLAWPQHGLSMASGWPQHGLSMATLTCSCGMIHAGR